MQRFILALAGIPLAGAAIIGALLLGPDPARLVGGLMFGAGVCGTVTWGMVVLDMWRRNT